MIQTQLGTQLETGVCGKNEKQKVTEMEKNESTQKEKKLSEFQ